MLEEDSGEVSSPLSLKVGGRLSNFWEVWQSFHVDPWVIQVLKEGYKIPFSAPPPTSTVPQEYASYLGNQEKFAALQTEVSEMLQKGQ